MKKLFTIVLVLMISSSFLTAQKGGINIGANVYFPVGDWAEYASTGYGGTIGYEHPLGKNVLGTIYSGYTAFSGDNDLSWTFIPLMVGAKFYFSPKQNFYGAALLGANFVTAEVSYEDITGETHTSSASETEFAGNLLLGYEIKTSESGAVDLSAGFVWINELSYFSLRVGYIFKF